MKTPRIDFMPARARRSSPWLWAALVVAAAMFAADTWWSARERGEQNRRSLDAYATAASAAALADAQTQAAALAAQAASASATGVLRPGDVLRAVESIRIPGVRVGALLIDVDQGLVRLEVELADLSQLTGCLETLAAAPLQVRWQATALQAANAQRPAVATLEAHLP